MTRRISNLSFPLLLFSIVTLIILTIIFIYKGQSVWTGLWIIIVLLFVLRNFTTIRIDGEKLSVIEYHLIKTDSSIIHLKEIDQFQITTNKRLVSIPGTASRSKADRLIENETFELVALDKNSNMIEIAKSSRFQKINRLANIISEHYDRPVHTKEKTLESIKKGFFKGFDISDNEDTLTDKNKK
ncbi:hypothetical protein [Mangrovibacterium diazotrophicum]|uniref:Uncharacterized protein n=1 Tax=Mangrovibacterium diazotrophicum TaxID=1261403 RepID=A0A419VW49_9BACT|nr:hypothetical protein [Mangrovibacterium diazotrophicum]RKD86387.1 hypothetical protein BC643_4078 [Mangrovibacterium diazotrophicum]